MIYLSSSLSHSLLDFGNPVYFATLEKNKKLAGTLILPLIDGG